jgi:gentisate 1,2-dioxygenase
MLAAPLHIHTREDEFSYVLQGRVGAVFGDEEVYADPGDLVFKPRGEWHTFWNAGDEELRILEIITPGGLEELFKRYRSILAERGPEALPALAAEAGCEVDLEQTMAVAQRHNLEF